MAYPECLEKFRWDWHTDRGPQDYDRDQHKAYEAKQFGDKFADEQRTLGMKIGDFELLSFAERDMLLDLEELVNND